MSKTRIFASFDIDHDSELYDLLLAQSQNPGSTFELSGGSERQAPTGVSAERVRRRICGADQMIVICGEHTEGSIGVCGELRIAQEAGTPYFLLWGRRGSMCTKPIGAKPSEGMFSWTVPILQGQVAFTLRNARADAQAEAAGAMKRVG